MAKLLFSCFIPGSPRAKGRHRNTKNGHVYADPKTEVAENRLMQIVSEKWKVSPLEGDVGVRITVYTLRPKSLKKSILFPRSKPDWDNYGKMVCDALNGVVWRDDCVIADGGTKKRFCNPEYPQAGFLLTVYHLTEEDL
jgi:Holliday junction resolvase RusA-like endonuclease